MQPFLVSFVHTCPFDENRAEARSIVDNNPLQIALTGTKFQAESDLIEDIVADDESVQVVVVIIIIQFVFIMPLPLLSLVSFERTEQCLDTSVE